MKSLDFPIVITPTLPLPHRGGGEFSGFRMRAIQKSLMSEVQCLSCSEGKTKCITEDAVAVPDHDKPVANPLIVLREEFDDWAILFDPDTGNSFSLNLTGVYLWKHLDGEHSIDDMLKTLRGDAHDVPEDTSDHIRAFVDTG
jgi:SynChlorMet cassette protein ScmD